MTKVEYSCPLNHTGSKTWLRFAVISRAWLADTCCERGAVSLCHIPPRSSGRPHCAGCVALLYWFIMYLFFIHVHWTKHSHSHKSTVFMDFMEEGQTNLAVAAARVGLPRVPEESWEGSALPPLSSAPNDNFSHWLLHWEAVMAWNRLLLSVNPVLIWKGRRCCPVDVPWERRLAVCFS